MKIQDWVSSPGTGTLDGASSPLKVQELLPASGISIGPPTAEDRVEISVFAHTLLQANRHLADGEEDRVEQLHAAYARGRWMPDAERMASRLVASLEVRAVELRTESEEPERRTPIDGLPRAMRPVEDSPENHLASLFGRPKQESLAGTASQPRRIQEHRGPAEERYELSPAR